MLVFEHLQRIAEQRATAPALLCGEVSLSYGTLVRKVEEVTTGLGALGIRHGTAFTILCENRLELMIAYYAAAKIGAIFVPINPSLTAQEVAHIFGHSDAVVLFHDEALRRIAETAVPKAKRAAVSDLFGSSGGQRSAPTERIEPSDDFIIVYTSGSTGTPKAVVLDQAAETAGNASLIELWGITATDVTVVALPLGFLYGLSTAAATGLQAGGKVVVLRRFHPGEVLEALVSLRATIFHGVPTMFSMMLEFAEQRRLSCDLSFMRLLICAGAPLSSELRERFAQKFGKPIDDYYALSEVRPIFGRFADDPTPTPFGAVGKAAPGVTAWIIDAQQRDCPDGAAGELVVRAPSTLKRYHKDQELTLQSMWRDGFKTGDLGYRDTQGFYHLTGRIKDIIIRGGANIAPAEVEGVISRHIAVQNTAVIGVPDRTFGEVPVAFVVRRHGAEVSVEELVRFCRAELAEFKVPIEFLFLTDLPLGMTGKIDKRALKAKWAELHA
jgi:long-chain acyl-CoA synthetase